MEAFPRIVRQIVLCVFSPLLGACVLAWVLLQLQSFKSRMWSKLGRSVYQDREVLPLSDIYAAMTAVLTAVAAKTE